MKKDSQSKNKETRKAYALWRKVTEQLRSGGLSPGKVSAVLDALIADDHIYSGVSVRIDPALLMNAFKIPVFTPEDTERIFKVKFTEAQKKKLHGLTQRLFLDLLADAVQNGRFSLKELNSQRAYIVIDPPGLSFRDMIENVGVSAFDRGQFTHHYWFEEEKFYYAERTRAGVALRFAQDHNLFWNRSLPEQNQALVQYSMEKSMDFTDLPLLCEELVGWLVFPNARTEEYRFYRTYFRTASQCKNGHHVVIGSCGAGGITIQPKEDWSREKVSVYPLSISRNHKLYLD